MLIHILFPLKYLLIHGGIVCGKDSYYCYYYYYLKLKLKLLYDHKKKFYKDHMRKPHKKITDTTLFATLKLKINNYSSIYVIFFIEFLTNCS